MVSALINDPGKYSFSVPSKSSTGTLMSKIIFEKLNLDVRMFHYESGGAVRSALRCGHVDITTGLSKIFEEALLTKITIALFNYIKQHEKNSTNM
jgi:tripartite-type tricarboxylate transporter receptor subunit TctC